MKGLPQLLPTIHTAVVGVPAVGADWRRGANWPASKIVQVWDSLLRVCHWTLAAGFAVAFIAGYIIAGAVAIRIMWGFIGPRHARFSDFVAGPRELLAHLADMLRFRERRYVGPTRPPAPWPSPWSA